MRLSRYLAGVRKRNRLLQKEVACRLDISREHYARIESGRITPSVKLLGTIAAEFHLEITVHVRDGRHSFDCRPARQRRRLRPA
jgi:transcriptional regulator with XRE-family HTH domain